MVIHVTWHRGMLPACYLGDHEDLKACQVQDAYPASVVRDHGLGVDQVALVHRHDSFSVEEVNDPKDFWKESSQRRESSKYPVKSM